MSLAASVTAVSERNGNGTHTATSPPNGRAPSTASSSSALALWLPCIFQLPTTSLRLIFTSCLPCEDDLADMRARLHQRMGRRRLVGWKNPVDHRPDASLLEQRPDLRTQRL